MKLHTRSTKGFTLVEIMIVVVIIGLLAAMAIPAFQKVRRSSIGKAMANDARQIGAAMQQIALEYPAACTSGVNMTITVGGDGSVQSGTVGTAPNVVPADQVAQYVKKVSRGTTCPTGYTFGLASTASSFSLVNPQCAPTDVIASSTTNTSSTIATAVLFDEEGKAL